MLRAPLPTKPGIFQGNEGLLHLSGGKRLGPEGRCLGEGQEEAGGDGEGK